MFWNPKWKKTALLTIKGANKFIHYKKDLISSEKIKSIQAFQLELKEAIRNKSQEEVKRKCNLLEQECQKSLIAYVRPNVITENMEVLFVAIVVALGLRAYYLQPFRIPTSSMQPTLNGINGHALGRDKWPSLPERIIQMATHGRTYINLTAKNDCSIYNIEDSQVAKFFTKTTISFSDGTKQSFSASANSIQQIIKAYQKNNPKYSGVYKPGEVIAQGFVDSGDLVLVDKVSYHFRQPTRGETFVFDTRGIEEIHKAAEYIYELNDDGNPVTGLDGQPLIKDVRLMDQIGGAHYIKRCVGLPGDKISINSGGNLIINGVIATDKGIQYAQNLSYNRQGDFTGYTLTNDQLYRNPLNSTSDFILLNGPEHKLTAEYAAFGDNTSVSLDSRYWGTIKQYNLVGPALFSLWPFTHEVDPHWGLVK